MTDTERNDLIKWISEKLGVPTAILAAMFVGLWWTASTVHETMVIPFMQGHAEYLKKSIENQDKNAQALNVLAEAAEREAANEGKQTELLGEIADSQEEIKEAVKHHPALTAPRQKP